jgi:hypothetical protein
MTGGKNRGFGRLVMEGMSKVRVQQGLSRASLTTLLLVAANCATRAAEVGIPKEFQGLWVEEADTSCPVLRRDDDALAAGGILLLRRDKMYSLESLCRTTGKVTKSCCDWKDRWTVAVNYLCAGEGEGVKWSKLRIIFHLRPVTNGQVLIKSWENAASGPTVTVYQKRCQP